jgi:hypothetical protein
MKKLLVLISVLLTTGLFAEGKLLFDLNAQYFSKTLAKEKSEDYGRHGKYDLENVIVDTSMIYSNKVYYNGNMTIALKNPVDNWTVIQSFIAKKNDYDKQGDTVFRISSTSGNSFYISITDDHIVVNGNRFKVGNTKGKKILLAIEKNGSKFVAKVNGSEFLTTKIDDFGKLYKIETMSIAGQEQTFDYISELEIYAK